MGAAPIFHRPRRAAGSDLHPLAALDDVGQLLGEGGHGHDHVQTDQLAEIQVGQGLVERLHPELLLAHLHGRVDLVDLVLADEVADGRVGDHDLHGQDAALAVHARQEGLGDDGLERHRQHDPDLGLVLAGEDVDDAADRLDGRVRVQGGEGQVTRLRDAESRLDRLEVAHLADQDDVRVLAQDRAQGVAVGHGVGVELALVDDGLARRQVVLDGVLDGDDVDRALRVDVLDHAGQRRRLAAAGRPGDEDEAPRQVAELLDALGDAQLGEAPHRRQEAPEGAGHGALLHEDIGPEAAELLDAEGEVELELLLEEPLLLVGHDAVDDLFRLRRRQRRVVQVLEDAVDADARRDVGRDVKVAGVALDAGFQQLEDRLSHGILRFSPGPVIRPGPSRAGPLRPR